MIGKRKVVKNKNVIVINPSKDRIISEELYTLLKTEFTGKPIKGCGCTVCDLIKMVDKELGGKKIVKRVKSKR